MDDGEVETVIGLAVRYQQWKEHRFNLEARENDEAWEAFAAPESDEWHASDDEAVAILEATAELLGWNTPEPTETEER